MPYSRRACGATWTARLASDQMVAGSNPVMPANAEENQRQQAAYLYAFRKPTATFLYDETRLYNGDTMAPVTKAMESQAEFREVGQSGVFVAGTEADRRESAHLLRQNGFKMLTYQEALVKIDKNPELKEVLKGNWFHIKGRGSQMSGKYLFDDNGELAPEEGNAEKTVCVWSGPHPLLLSVLRDYTGAGAARFELSADSVAFAAPMVVGVRELPLRD